MDKNRICTMSVARVYPLYVKKVQKKGRTQAEVDKLIDELAKGKTMEKILRK